MNIVLTKYNNFKKLCEEIDASNEWVIYLANFSLEAFLYTFKEKLLKNPNATIDSLYMDLVKESKILEDNISPEESNRIKRYISYFMEIVNSLL